MLDAAPEVSDLLFTVDKPLQVEAAGELMPVACEPPIERLTPFQTEMVALNLMGENQWHIKDLLKHGSCDSAYTVPEKARLRINIFSQRGHYSIVLRKLNTRIPTLEELKSPEILNEIPKGKDGPRAGHGSHGLRQVHHHGLRAQPLQPDPRAIHIITLEDPVEFIHLHDKATFNQRELGTDFDNFSSGLRAARCGAGAQGHPGGGNARPRHSANRPERGGDGSPGVKHAPHR